jgi:hypothetical protein
MREFELIIDEALRNGLSPDESAPTNSPYLYECLGVRCGRQGIEKYKLLTNPITVSAYNWPFPQFFAGEKYNILVVRDTANARDLVYSVSDDHLTVTLIATLLYATYGTGYLMEVADFGKYAFMTNGVAMVYYNVLGSAWTIMTSSATIPRMGTICNFKGQAVGGNVRTVWYDCDSTYYLWTKIGSMDFTPDIDNEAGYRRDPYGGEIYHTKRIDEVVVGYSSKGIIQLVPVSNPTPTFGFKKLLGLGLINRGAVNGDKDTQVFVCEDLVVRMITNEGVKELGYQYLMEELVGDIIVSHNPSNNDFYIGDSTRTFLLSPNGMTEVQQHPSTVWRRNKVSYLAPATADVDLPFIATWPVDYGYAGQKTSQTVELSGEGFTGAYATVDYNLESTWVTKPYVEMNKQKISSAIAAGNEFRLRVKFTTLLDNFKLAHLKSRFKMTDLRGIRGVYAPPLRGQGA